MPESYKSKIEQERIEIQRKLQDMGNIQSEEKTRLIARLNLLTAILYKRKR